MTSHLRRTRKEIFSRRARGEEFEQYKRLRGRDEDDDNYSPVTEQSLVEYVPSSAAMRPAWFGSTTSSSRTSGGDVLREIEVALIKCTKYAGALLRENNF